MDFFRQDQQWMIVENPEDEFSVDYDDGNEVALNEIQAEAEDCNYNTNMMLEPTKQL